MKRTYSDFFFSDARLFSLHYFYTRINYSCHVVLTQHSLVIELSITFKAKKLLMISVNL
jgi:hypothetical protein